MAEHGNKEGGGEVVDQPEDRGGPMTVEETDQTMVERVRIKGADIGGGGDGDQGREQEAVGGEEHRAIEPEPRAMDEAGAVGPRVDPEGSSTTVEGSPAVWGSDVVSDSGTIGDDTGPNKSPPRGSDKGKGAVIEEEQTTENVTVEIREENIAFRPLVIAATSSSHVPFTFDDIAEHTPNKILAKLLEDNPTIREYVLKAKED
ncbi:hypothetical protein RHMOL_Rhmol02G0182500 [Rhododendron molle]|uniref:Uncharacterized protein n=1 Tax=Rhododendron molle TaxID=49168 RepID=A0ACC0PRY6_RHOML|nr:hypothetical protein RHMOL_Rhmol02G0182500 [Rhododendron molle]